MDRICGRGIMGGIAVLLAGLAWAPVAVLAQLPSGNLIQDAGFEPGTALHSFSRSPGNPWIPGEWNAESANVINGAITGINPQTGSGMLRINAAGGNSSQVNQIIDVSSFAADIDAGNAVVRFSIWMNAPTANVSPGLLLQAGESQNPNVGVLVPVGGSFINGYNKSILTATLDGDSATWEKIEGAIALPGGTRFLELQFFESVASIPPDGIFFDSASVVLMPCEALVDGGFDSGSAPLQPFSRGPGDPPWTPGEWNAETANLIVGPSAGVSPWFGDGMLRVNTSFNVSQVNQIVDLSGFADAIDNGGVTARMSSWFNAAEAGNSVSARYRYSPTLEELLATDHERSINNRSQDFFSSVSVGGLEGEIFTSHYDASQAYAIGDSIYTGAAGLATSDATSTVVVGTCSQVPSVTDGLLGVKYSALA